MKEMKRALVSVMFGVVALVAAFFALDFGLDTYHRAAYPLGYAELIDRYSEQYNLPPELVYSVVRTESHFRAGAQSHVGARGLMQITYDTFEWIQMRTGDKEHTFDDMYDPETNVRYGTYLLAVLIEEFKNEDTAMAAYHAGRGQVTKWLQDKNYSADGQTLTHIPFDDTSAYVAKVRRTVLMYVELYDF